MYTQIVVAPITPAAASRKTCTSGSRIRSAAFAAAAFLLESGDRRPVEKGKTRCDALENKFTDVAMTSLAIAGKANFPLTRRQTAHNIISDY